MLYYSDEKDILNLKDKDVAVIIPLSCDGLADYPLAKRFFEKYPNMKLIYTDDCNLKSLDIGHCTVQNSIYGIFIFFPVRINSNDDGNYSEVNKTIDSLLAILDYLPDLKVAIPKIGMEKDRSLIVESLYNKTKDYKNDLFLVGW